MLGVTSDSNTANHFLEFNEFQVAIFIHEFCFIFNSHLRENEAFMDHSLVENHLTRFSEQLKILFCGKSRTFTLVWVSWIICSLFYHIVVYLNETFVIIKEQLIQPLVFSNCNSMRVDCALIKLRFQICLEKLWEMCWDGITRRVVLVNHCFCHSYQEVEQLCSLHGTPKTQCFILTRGTNKA